MIANVKQINNNDNNNNNNNPIFHVYNPWKKKT